MQRIIGITGGIGSGKSTVTRILKDEFNIKVIDADEISREITKKGSIVLNDLINCFGRDILHENGELNRSKLAESVFKDKNKLGDLNKIMHTHIPNVIKQKIKEYEDEEIIVIEAAIPLEEGFLNIATEIWVVISDIDKRIDRVIKQRGLTYQHIIDRISSQINDEQYCKIANFIIYNNGDFELLKKQAIENFKNNKEKLF